MSRSANDALQQPTMQPAPPTPDVHHAFLWFGLFGGPAAWSLQLLINYPLMAHACYPGKLPLGTPTSGRAWAVAVAINALMILITLAAGATAISTWRRSRGELAAEPRGLLENRPARTHFMAYAGMLVSGLFLFALIMSAMPLFIVPACSYGA